MTTLDNIRNKIRQLTGRKSASQLTDAQIDEQVNWYYLYEFPEACRTLDLRTEYSFVTTPNVDVYPISANTFMSFEPMGYVAGYPTIFTEDRSTFHRLFPDISGDYLLATATAVIGAGPYTSTITGSPFLKKSVMVYVSTGFDTGYSASDNGLGSLIDPAGNVLGTVNYGTGLISITWLAIPPVGAEIRVQARPYAATRPTTIFYWEEKLTLRPVPDKAYTVRLIAYQTPTALIAGVSPSVAEWWEALAYGASMKIFENVKDLESAGEMEQLLERKLVLLGRRQWFVMRSQRASTIYSTPVGGTNPSSYLGWFGAPW